ncbi:MAG TPA: hydroxymethylbilane synthase [Desulfomonilaceae bacterium]|nr:hydroxymethylbilane synthase [Desulfomonilaceae bacterium]
MNLTIGTRGSALALWQAEHVAAAIEKRYTHVHVALRKIKTQGDKILDTPLAKIGTKGLFTKEIEEALLEGRVNLAVHSMKDVPTDLPRGLKLAAVMQREDPRDVFLSRDGRGLRDLKAGERIGTSSLRRKAFLLNRFPGLDVISIRGNVETRIRKIETENLSGILLAAAGIKRMGMEERITEYVDPEIMIPAIGQGALAIEIREDDPETEAFIAHLNDPGTATCVRVERAFLMRLGGGCQVPIAAHCTQQGSEIRVAGAVVHPDGNPIFRDLVVTNSSSPDTGTRLADALIKQGADEILQCVFSNEWEPGPTMDII